MKTLDNIIRQRIDSLSRYVDDPPMLLEKLEELEYFVRKKRLEVAH